MYVFMRHRCPSTFFDFPFFTGIFVTSEGIVSHKHGALPCAFIYCTKQTKNDGIIFLDPDYVSKQRNKGGR